MKHKKTYTPELREEAVKLVLAQGMTLGEAASRIAIPKGLFWLGECSHECSSS
ncbi:MAG: transposase [Pseudomonadota bacterium]